MIDILQLLIYGIVLGSIVALGAIGVSLVFGILRFANFAHGDLMTIGAFFALFFVVDLGFPVLPAAPLAMLSTVAVALLCDRVLYRPLRRTAPVILLISSFGVALILRSVIQLVWGTSNHVFQQGIQKSIHFAGLRIKPDQVSIIVGTVVLVVLLHLFLQRTRIGKGMRAMADNVDLARITGIDTERVVMWTWIIAAILATAAGIFLGMDTRLHPVMGWRLLLPVFAAAILGGIGKPYGAIAGGMVIGIVQEFSTLIISPAYKPAVAFALMVVMLIVRPTGLLGGRQ